MHPVTCWGSKGVTRPDRSGSSQACASSPAGGQRVSPDRIDQPGLQPPSSAGGQSVPSCQKNQVAARSASPSPARGQSVHIDQKKQATARTLTPSPASSLSVLSYQKNLGSSCKIFKCMVRYIMYCSNTTKSFLRTNLAT
jgi:hypothetical protein